MRWQALRLLVPGSVMAALSVVGAVSTTGVTASAVAAPAAATGGDFCTTDEGVTVVVDLSAFGDGIVVRCVDGPLGSSFTGWEALQEAGFSPQSVATQGGFVCRLAGEPAVSRSLAIPGDDQYHEQCQRTPPQTAYWAYSYADNGARWTYSTIGAANRSVIEGGFEGWVFSLNGSSTAPAIAPSHPHTSAPTQPPASTVTPPAPTAPAHPGPPHHSPTSHPGPTSAAPSGSASSEPTAAPTTSTTQPAPTRPAPTQPSTTSPAPTPPAPTPPASTQSPDSSPRSHGQRPGAAGPTKVGSSRTHPGSRPTQAEDVTEPPNPPQSTGDAVVTSELPAAADEQADAGSKVPLMLGLGLLAALALGAGLTAWRRSHSA